MLIVGVVIAVQAWHKRNAVYGLLLPFSASLADGGEINAELWQQGHAGRATAI